MFFASVPVRISSNFSNVAVGTFSRPSFLPDAKFFYAFPFLFRWNRLRRFRQRRSRKVAFVPTKNIFPSLFLLEMRSLPSDVVVGVPSFPERKGLQKERGRDAASPTLPRIRTYTYTKLRLRAPPFFYPGIASRGQRHQPALAKRALPDDDHGEELFLPLPVPLCSWSSFLSSLEKRTGNGNGFPFSLRFGRGRYPHILPQPLCECSAERGAAKASFATGAGRRPRRTRGRGARASNRYGSVAWKGPNNGEG